MLKRTMSLSLLVKFKLWQIAVNTAIFIAVFSFAFLLGKYLESLIVLISYFLLRYRFDKTFHHKNMWICVALSILMCWIMIAISLPIQVSILSGIVVALVDGYILYKVKDYYDIKEGYHNAVLELEEINKPKPFNVDTCTKEALLARCEELKFPVENTELAVMFFIDKIKQSEIADKLCVEEKSITTRKKRMKAKLNTNQN